MPRKPKLRYAWKSDFTGLYLFITDGQNKTLVNRAPIIDLGVATLIMAACDELSTDLAEQQKKSEELY